MAIDGVGNSHTYKSEKSTKILKQFGLMRFS